MHSHFHPRPKDLGALAVVSQRRRKMHGKLSHILSRRSNVVVLAFLCFLFLTATRLRHGAVEGGGASAQWRLPALRGPATGATGRPQTSPPPPPIPQDLLAADPPPLPDPPHRDASRPVLEPGECIEEIEYLKRPSLRLSGKIIYSRRCIRPVWRRDVDRDEVVNISRPLVTKRTMVDLSACSHVEYVPCDHMTLDVPYPYPSNATSRGEVRNYAHLLFGVATSFDRLNESRATFTPWLAGTEAQLLAIVTDAEEQEGEDGEGGESRKQNTRQKPNLTALQEEFRAANMSVTLMRPSDAAQRTSVVHFTMLADLVARVTPETEWIGIVDDDTFFPSLYPLSAALAEHDHTVPAYLGSLTEDFGAVRNWGYMAFGGAGIFLSVPLARQLVTHMDACLAEAADNGPGGFEGDGLLRDCIYHHTTTHLTQVPGLWQQDMYYDASGFFESGVRVLSLHHWKSWYRAPVVAMAMVALMCGDCFLQRWRFGNDTVFTNGYSIAMYRDGLEHLDLDKVEGTWQGAGRDYEFRLGPVRPALGPDEKKSFVLVDAEVPRWGAFRQIYVHRGDAEREEPDEVIELLWEG